MEEVSYCFEYCNYAVELICSKTISNIILGSSMWSLQAQHCCLHSRKRIPFEKSSHDSSFGSANIWAVDVWKEPTKSKGHGAADPEQTSAQRVCLQSRRRVPRVSSFLSDMVQYKN